MKIKKTIQNVVGALAIGISTLLPLQSKAYEDEIRIGHNVGQKAHELTAAHKINAVDGLDGLDVDYSTPPPWKHKWGPKITTRVGGHEFEEDFRFTNSTLRYDGDLKVFIENGQNIQATNYVRVINVKGFDPKRFYLGDYLVLSNYTANGLQFHEKKNIRDLCLVLNTYFDWSGPNLNLLASQVDTNNEVNFGKFTLFCDWNKIVSTLSGSGFGLNSFSGVRIVDYGTNLVVGLNAFPGNFVQGYILTRTDNIGNVSTTTNFIPNSTNFYNVILNNLKGSNQVHGIYRHSTLAVLNDVWALENGFAFETGAEVGSVFFSLEKLVSNEWTQIGDLIPAKGIANGGMGGFYSVSDTNLTLGQSCVFRIKEIDDKGRIIEYGPFDKPVEKFRFSSPLGFTSDGKPIIEWYGGVCRSDSQMEYYIEKSTNSLMNNFFMLRDKIPASTSGKTCYTDDVPKKASSFYRIGINK